MFFLACALALICLSVAKQSSADAASTPTNPAQCRILPGKQFHGFVYVVNRTKSLDDCMQLCNENQPKCKSGQWFSNGKCYLKSKSAGKRMKYLLDRKYLLERRTRDDEITTYFEPCLELGNATSPTTASTGVASVTKSIGADLVTASSGVDLVTASTGADLVVTSTGVDLVTTNTGVDLVTTNTSVDLVPTSIGVDLVTTTGVDLVTASSGVDLATTSL